MCAHLDSIHRKIEKVATDRIFLWNIVTRDVTIQTIALPWNISSSSLCIFVVEKLINNYLHSKVSRWRHFLSQLQMRGIQRRIMSCAYVPLWLRLGSCNLEWVVFCSMDIVFCSCFVCSACYETSSCITRFLVTFTVLPSQRNYVVSQWIAVVVLY